MALSNIAARKDNPLDGFRLFGVVKEIGIDDAGLAKFYNEFYTFPLYRDESLSLYHALGDRQLSFLTSWNPFAIFGQWNSVMSRLKGKDIETNWKGEGIVQGGVILFDSEGKPKFAYKEKTGDELPVEDILAAVNAMKDGL